MFQTITVRGNLSSRKLTRVWRTHVHVSVFHYSSHCNSAHNKSTGWSQSRLCCSSKLLTVSGTEPDPNTPTAPQVRNHGIPCGLFGLAALLCTVLVVKNREPITRQYEQQMCFTLWCPRKSSYRWHHTIEEIMSHIHAEVLWLHWLTLVLTHISST